MRKLSIKTLECMEGQEVIVKDLEYDAYDQVCTVRLVRDLFKNYKGEYQIYTKEIILENEEFIYVGSCIEGCVNGKFEVYSKR